jgi:CelD/BcsL family acetyltransferase involved in cellulose biosynthesis
MGQFVEFQSSKPLSTKGLRSSLPNVTPLRVRSGATPSPAIRAPEGLPRPEVLPAQDVLPALQIEVRSIVSCSEIAAQWHDLCARALEPNGFQTPAFLLAGAQHLPASAPPAAILIWEPGPRDTARLMGLIPLVGERGALARSIGARELKAYISPYHNLGVPHVDAQRAVDVLGTLLAWLASDPHGATAITWPQIPLGGMFASALKQAAQRGNRRIAIQNEHARAILPQATKAQRCEATISIDDGLPSKHRREFARLERRLAGMGAVRYHEAEGTELRNALEMFLALEASGWKGREGTALLQTARSSAFIRTGLRGSALTGQARIIWLTLNDATIAAGLVYEHGGRAWLAKIAHDEELARVAPGIMLVRAFSRRQIAREDILLTDSCAVDDRNFISDIWPTHMALGDITVGIQTGRTPGLVAVQARQLISQRLRALLKRGYRAFATTEARGK